MPLKNLAHQKGDFILKNDIIKSMFDKFKQLMQLKGLQDEIKKQRFESEKNGVKVVINGGFNVEEIKINPALNQQEQENLLRDCFNQAVRNAQMAMAQKFSGLM